MILLSLSRCATLGGCLNLDIVMACTAMSNLPNPESQIGCPTIVWYSLICDRIPSTTPGAEPPRDAKDSGSARSHSTHLETSSSDRP